MEALRTLVAGLPADLPASIFITVHVPAHVPSVLPGILSRSGPLPAEAADGPRPIRPGRIYVAPPDRHLIIRKGTVEEAMGPREHGLRPAADPMFRSAAAAYGARVVGVVLSGSLDDGTAGLAAIKRCGGVALVQDPREALSPGMPTSAIDKVAVDHVEPIGAIARRLASLARTPVKEGLDPAGDCAGEGAELDLETDMAELGPETLNLPEKPGDPSAFSCPECGGTLYEVREGEFVRFRCRNGHAYSPETLLSQQWENLEAALWTALRVLEESTLMSRRPAQRADQRGDRATAERFR